MVKKSLAKYGKKNLDEIEKIWNGLNPPYESLFLWLDNKGKYPIINNEKIFHSFMLATSFDTKLIQEVKSSNNYFFEYKWDGIRVQIVSYNETTTVYSRSGDDISNSFPEIKINSKKLLVIDGEMLVGSKTYPLKFNKLQKRINKKKPSNLLTKQLPAFVKVYDILFLNDKDLREKSLLHRRKELEKWYDENKNINLDISKIIEFDSEKKLLEIYDKYNFIEGVMIKGKSSPYLSGRKKGHWFKWKSNPKYIDTILMYAQRGHGKKFVLFRLYTGSLVK